MPPSQNDLRARFGDDAVRRLAGLVGIPPADDPAIAPASRSRSRSALVGAAVGANFSGMSPSQQLDALAGRPGLRVAMGPDAHMALMVADSLLSSASDHPVRFAARLAAGHVRGVGQATITGHRLLREGRPWWDVAAGNSAGAAAAARSLPFGLLWSGKPEWAAYEAALSASVTHGHAEAIAGAAATASAVALAAQGSGPLGRDWLAAVADTCEQYPQDAVYGRTVAQMVRRIPSLLHAPLEMALEEIGTHALATQAVPAALLWAAAARPLDWSENPDSWEPLWLLARCHSAVGAIAGACVGARFGEQIWPGLEQVGHSHVVIRTADRIAGKRVRPVRRPRPKRAEGDKPPVHVSFLINRSGSMGGMEGDVVGGFNEFVKEQREVEGECSLTLVQFDTGNPHDVLIDAQPVDDVPEMTVDQYRPRGGTPLLDALGEVIEDADARLDEGRDEDQIVVIFTDGQENASSSWTRERIVTAVNERQEEGWTFVFMGAGLNSYREAGRMGIRAHSIQDMASDSLGMKAAWGSVGKGVARFRDAGLIGRREASEKRFFEKKEAEEDLLRRKGGLRQADEAARRRAERRRQTQAARGAPARGSGRAEPRSDEDSGGGKPDPQREGDATERKA